MKKTSKRTGGSRKRSRGSRPSPVGEVLAAFAAVAGRQKARWYLFGAQAVIVYGMPRLTADVDVTVELPEARVSALVTDLERAGFRLRVEDPAKFFERTRVLPFAFPKAKLALDVVVAGPGLETLFLASVRRLDVQGTRVPVIAPEHLVVLKILAGRAKDLEDARFLVHSDDLAVDRRAVRQVIRALEDALGQSDLTPVLDALLRDPET